MFYDEAIEHFNICNVFQGFIPIKPKPKQSFAMGKHGGFTPDVTKKYVQSLKKWWLQHWQCGLIEGTIYLKCCFCVKFRQTDAYAAEKVPLLLNMTQVDLDNLQKPLQDAMQGVVMRKDEQVCVLNSCKIRCNYVGTGVQIFTIRQNFKNIHRVT